VREAETGEAASELARQLMRKRRNNLLPVARALLLEAMSADALADPPVKVDLTRFARSLRLTPREVRVTGTLRFQGFDPTKTRSGL